MQLGHRRRLQIGIGESLSIKYFLSSQLNSFLLRMKVILPSEKSCHFFGKEVRVRLSLSENSSESISGRKLIEVVP